MRAEKNRSRVFRVNKGEDVGRHPFLVQRLSDVIYRIMEMGKVELLSPAGTYECFLAAVAGGADAVYLGLNKFGARANAGNLSTDELLRALDIAHIRGRKIYLTVNTLMKDGEIGELRDFLYEPYRSGLDGVIVQDIGAMSIIHESYPDLPIHVSTQAAITGSLGAEYLKSLGVTRVVPARELSLKEISKMKKETGLELECFIHGSMCYSYSGKCLLSSFIGGRSGNRGRCAQPCRLMYEGKYPLSLKDMCTIDILPELIGAGISSFKIEGRMKSSEYVYSVTSIYRKYIAIYYDSSDYAVSDDDRKRLISAYTRSGNCDGYYFRHNGREMVTLKSPSYSTETDKSLPDVKSLLPDVDINVKCTIRCGENAVITISDGINEATTVTGVIADKALTRALTRDEITSSLRKCKGTGFCVKDCTVECDDDIFIPKSRLNEIRRQGIEEFKRSATAPYKREITGGNVRVGSKNHCLSIPESDRVKVIASILNRKQLKAVLSSECDGVAIPMGLFRDCKEDLKAAPDKELYIELPYIIREEGRENSRVNIERFVKYALANFPVAGLYASNLETVRILSGLDIKPLIVADVFLYAYNNEAYDFYKENGVDKTTVPIELNGRELIKRGIKGEELIVYGRSPVMVSANCTYKTLYGCDSHTGEGMYLTDRKNEKLFVNRICKECTNVIYNSVVTCITDEEALFDEIRPSSVRFCFTDEDGDEIKRILDRYYSLRNENGSTREQLIDKYTRGHIKRGVE